MAWPKFGREKEPEEKKDDVQSKADVDALVDRIGSSIEERFFKPLESKVTALQTKWDEIEKAATAPPKETNEDGTPKVLSEEEKNKLGTQATFAMSVQTNARLTEREVIDEISSSWSHLLPDIRAYFTNTPLARKAQADYPDYCRNIADMVIGKAAKAAGLRYDGQNKSFFLEDKSTSVTREEGPLSDPSLVWHQQKPDGSTKTWSVADQLAALKIDPKELSDNMKKGIV